MMLIEEKVFSALSPLVDGRVYPQIVPVQNNEYPVITYSTIAVNGNNTVCGTSDEDVHLQIDIYGKDALEVLRLRQSVFEAIEQTFPGSARSNDFDSYEHEADLYRRILEFLV